MSLDVAPNSDRSEEEEKEDNEEEEELQEEEGGGGGEEEEEELRSKKFVNASRLKIKNFLHVCTVPIRLHTGL